MTQYDVERREWGTQYPAYVKWLDILYEKGNLCLKYEKLRDIDLSKAEWYDNFYFNDKGVSTHVIVKDLTEETRKEVLVRMYYEYDRLLGMSVIPYTQKQKEQLHENLRNRH